MKAIVLIAALSIAALSSLSAQAQTSTVGATTGTSVNPGGSAGGKGGAKFAEHKQAALARMDQHEAKMAATRACLSAATTPAEAKACHSSMGKR